MNLNSILEIIVGCIVGGTLTAAGGFLLLGTPIAKLQVKQDTIQKALTNCRDEHNPCVQVVSLSPRLDDIINRLERMEGIMMDGRKS